MADPETKLIFITCDEGVEPDVLATMQQMQLTHYTRWTNCTGSGETGTHEGTAVWPGLNSVIMVLLGADEVGPLWERLAAVRDSFTVTPGLKMMVLDAAMM